jgi:cell division protein FtsI (penicillin-binding protein 3)
MQTRHAMHTKHVNNRFVKNSFWRYYFIYGLLIFLLAALLVRLVQLNIFQSAVLISKSDSAIIRQEIIPASRGIIYDRNGVPLAISATVKSIWIDPTIFNPSFDQLGQLSHQLMMSVDDIESIASHEKQKHFVYVKRRIDPSIAQSIMDLKIPGVFDESSYRRFYPSAEVDAQIVGLTNIDDDGQSGLELAFNAWLAGQTGEKRVMRDRLGQTISNLGDIKPSQDGKDLTLSIDQRIQFSAYMALMDAIEKYHAQSGSVVVMNPKTGEILAMVNAPSFNPNALPKNSGQFRNIAVTDMYEPGSVMKPFTVAMGLQSGLYTPDSTIDTNPGWLHVGGYTVRDDSYNGVVNITQLLQKSSNIAAAKMMLSLNPTEYWQFLHQIGFGQTTGSGFPGESGGTMKDRAIWRPSVVASMAYGYGISVTALQLAEGYSVLANHGVKVPVSFIKQITPEKGSQVIDPKIADEVITMLKSVLEPGGNGTKARVDGYEVAGKTGTAYVAKNGGYDTQNFNSSFVGVAPADDPQLVVAVMIHSPQGEHFGAQVAAPAFSKIMGSALDILNISPK